MKRVLFVCVENSNRSQMAEAFARIHGVGKVEAASAGVGRGATFTVRLRTLSQPAAPRHATASDRQEPPRMRLVGVRVLVTDDNVDAAESLATALEGEGATVAVALSGAMAIAEWEARPADVLLCDLAMPGMDGFEVLRRIRAIDAERGHAAPAIAVTAHATGGHVARSLSAGFAACVAKPYHFPELVEMMLGLLARPHQQDALRT